MELLKNFFRWASSSETDNGIQDERTSSRGEQILLAVKSAGKSACECKLVRPHTLRRSLPGKRRFAILRMRTVWFHSRNRLVRMHYSHPRGNLGIEQCNLCTFIIQECDKKRKREWGIDDTDTTYRTEYLHFPLENCGANIPFVTGTEAIIQAPSIFGQQRREHPSQALIKDAATQLLLGYSDRHGRGILGGKAARVESGPVSAHPNAVVA